ncbi:MAG TPA: CMP deaminase, partial [Flavobacterium sp.]|nr:CMP deaminase [Flavobacterium sp.]
IRRVVYQQGYSDDSGIDFLIRAGVVVEHLPNLED